MTGTNTAALSTSQSYSAFLNTGANDFFITNAELGSDNSGININGVFLRDYGLIQGAVDAKSIANAINASTTLRDMGIRATASSFSITASSTFNASDDITLRIYLGQAYQGPNIEVSITNGLDIDDLVNAINNQAGGTSLTATNNNGKLSLTSLDGSTIGIEVVNNSGGDIELGMFSSQTGTIANDKTGSAIHVGQLSITAPDFFSYDFTGISAASGGLDINPASGQAGIDAGTYNETSNTVEVYGGQAELSMLITSRALQQVDTVRAQIGATMNNLQSIFDAQKVAFDNTKEAESVIRNTDYAKEMSEFTTYQIRMQATIAMLAQANTLPQLVLQLMR